MAALGQRVAVLNLPRWGPLRHKIDDGTERLRESLG
jgi:hypothetical protein